MPRIHSSIGSDPTQRTDKLGQLSKAAHFWRAGGGQCAALTVRWKGFIDFQLSILMTPAKSLGT